MAADLVVEFGGWFAIEVEVECELSCQDERALI